MPVPCPDCASPLPPDPACCAACALPLTGPTAARLWQVDRQIDALRVERTGLLALLRSERTSSPGAVAPVARPGTAAGGVLSWSAQRLLLSAGVVLLLVAAVVFVGIAWTRIGVVGQCAVLLGVTGATLAACRGLARRGLLTSAEACAALFLGLTWLDLQAAHRLDLLGLARVPADRYDVAALLLLTAAAAGAARVVRPSLVLPAGALVAAALVPLAVLELVDAGLLGTGLVAACAVLLGVAATVVATGARRPLLAVVLVCTVAWTAVAVTAAGSHAYFADLDETLPSVVALLGVVAGLTLLARTGRLALAVRTSARVAAAAVLVVLAVAVVAHGGVWGLTALSVAGSTAVAALALTRRTRLTAAGGYALGWTAGLLAEVETAAAPAQRGVWLAALAAAAAVVAVSRPSLRAPGAVAGALTSALCIALLVQDAAPVVQVGALLALTATLVLLAGWRTGHDEELALAAGSVAAGLAALGYATLDPSPGAQAVGIAVVLACGGVLALGYACLPGRGGASVAGVLLCSGATWSLTADASVDVVEAYTLPLALLALAVGGVRHHRYPQAPSWTTVGPGLSAALIPSALAATGDDSLTRPLLVLLAAVATVLLGTHLRWQAPVVTGSVAATLVALSQLAPVAVGAPRWLSLAVAGAVLLVLGTRYERNRRDAGEVASWVGSLR